MLYILAGVIFGSVLCYSFVKEFLEMRHGTKKALATAKDFVKNDHSLWQRILSIAGVAIGIFAAVYSSGAFDPAAKDDLTVALGIALALMFVGQYLAILYHASYWINDQSLITCGKLIRFKSVKSIRTKRSSFMKNFTVTTYSGDEILVSKKTALALQEKTGKKIAMQ